jgi:hypothetical protein
MAWRRRRKGNEKRKKDEQDENKKQKLSNIFRPSKQSHIAGDRRIP